MLLINPQEMMITAVDDNDGFCCCFPAREPKPSNVQDAFTASLWPLRQTQESQRSQLDLLLRVFPHREEMEWNGDRLCYEIYKPAT